MKINFFKIDIPCLHRIHFEDNLSNKNPQWIQKQLGFSINIKDLIEKLETILNELKKENYNIESNGKIPITFDDGYKELINFDKIFIKERFFEYFQPIVFLPVSLLIQPNSVLWFDKLYYILSSLSEKDLLILYRKYEIKKKRNIRLEKKDYILNLTNGILKKKLRNLNNKKQHKLLDHLTRKFKICFNANKIHEDLYLNKKDISELINNNWILGSHGMYHHKFDCIGMSTLKKELTKSLEIIIKLGGKSFLAFPDGYYNEFIYKSALKVGFSHLFALYSNNIISPDYIINRVIWN